MRRAVHFALLSLLLLFLQHQGQVHPITHLAAVGADRQSAALHSPPAQDDCLECALLASGTHVAIGDSPVAAASGIACPADLVAFAQRAPGACAWFESRAPPVLL